MRGNKKMVSKMKFNGKLYTYKNSAKTKSNAKAMAFVWRKKGYNARVTALGKGTAGYKYDVWVRKKR